MKDLVGLKFCSGFLTTAEFHAGKNFFGIVYRDHLLFNEDGVILSKEVILPFRPMDSADIEWFNQYRVEGSYVIKDNFVECYFEKLSWRFSGILEETSDKIILILSNYDERLRKSWSVVYEECV